MIALPPRSLVLLVGASGSGKSTFARQHFRSTEVISSDHCRALVSDDEADQSASRDAFEVVYLIAAKRLARGLVTVVDATNVSAQFRQPLIALARTHGADPVAIVLDLPVETLIAQNLARPGRRVEEWVVRKQAADLAASLPTIDTEGFVKVHLVRDPAGVRVIRADRH